jgi:hypothetical protein
MEGVQAALTTRNLEPNQWRNKEEWCLVSGKQQLLKNRTDRIYFVRSTEWVGSKQTLNNRYRFCNIKAIIMKIMCIYVTN